MDAIIAELTNLANGSNAAGDELAEEICCNAIQEIERLRTELADARNAVKLALGRQSNHPWPDVSDASVDGLVNYIRNQREAAEAKEPKS